MVVSHVATTGSCLPYLWYKVSAQMLCKPHFHIIPQDYLFLKIWNNSKHTLCNTSENMFGLKPVQYPVFYENINLIRSFLRTVMFLLKLYYVH